MAIKTRIIPIFTTIFAVAAFAAGALAQDTPVNPPTDGPPKADRMQRRQGREHRKFGRPEMGPGRGMHGLRGIELTDAQKQQLKAIYEANKPSQQDMELMRSLAEARRNGTLTEDQKAQLRQLRDARRQTSEAIRTQIQGILTDEQKAQLEAKRTEMKQRMEQWKQQRRERRADRPDPKTAPEPMPTENN